MENAGIDVTVPTLIRVLDMDSREGGAGDLVFKILTGDDTAFTLEANPLEGGWWEVYVKTTTVSIHTLVAVAPEIAAPPLPLQNFDYELGPRSFELQIEARDKITPIMYGTTNLTVTIVDVNDQSPAFTSPSYFLSVSLLSPACHKAFIMWRCVYPVAREPSSGWSCGLCAGH